MLEQRTQIEKNLIVKDEIVKEALHIAYIQIQTMNAGYARFWSMPDILATLNHSPMTMAAMMAGNKALGTALNAQFDAATAFDPELAQKYPLRVTLSMPEGFVFDEVSGLFTYTPPVVETPEEEV